MFPYWVPCQKLFIQAVVTGLAQVSFHGTSGTYPSALLELLEFEVLQYGAAGHADVAVSGHQLKSVPPTAVLKGVEASPLTEFPNSAGAGTPLESPPASQEAAPESPVETKTAIPSEAAVCHRL